MKIAFVNNNYHLGGAETVVRQLHEGCLNRGIESVLHVTEGKTWPRAKGLKPLYPRMLARLDHSRLRRLIRRWAPRSRWTDRTFRSLAEGDLDLIHLHSYHGLYASIQSLAHLAKTKPILWTFHRFWGITGGCDHPFDCNRYMSGCGNCPRVGEFPIGQVDHTAQEWRQKKALLSPLPLHIIAPSQHLADRVARSTLGSRWQISVIHNGVAPGQFMGKRKFDPAFRKALCLSPDKVTVFFTNRDFKDPIKGFPIIKKALQSQQWPDIQILLAGGNSTWAKAQLPHDLDVLDLGYISDRQKLADYHEAAEIYLYASEGENFPCAILEAMSSECCVVSTPVDGVTEQVEDRKSGRMADSNTGIALGQVLRDALFNLEATRSMGKSARQRVEACFTESEMIEKHLRLYEDTLH